MCYFFYMCCAGGLYVRWIIDIVNPILTVHPAPIAALLKIAVHFFLWSLFLFLLLLLVTSVIATMNMFCHHPPSYIDTLIMKDTKQTNKQASPSKCHEGHVLISALCQSFTQQPLPHISLQVNLLLFSSEAQRSGWFEVTCEWRGCRECEESRVFWCVCTKK